MLTVGDIKAAHPSCLMDYKYKVITIFHDKLNPDAEDPLKMLERVNLAGWQVVFQGSDGEDK